MQRDRHGLRVLHAVAHGPALERAADARLVQATSAENGGPPAVPLA